MPTLEMNGLTAHYCDAGSAQAAVLLHAGGTCGKHWRKVAPLLEDGFRLLVPDLIGFGETDSWSGDRDLEHDDQADMVRALIARAGAEPAHLVGHSYGGATAVRLALRYPHAVRSLVLIEPVLTPLLREADDQTLYSESIVHAERFIADAEAGRDVEAWRYFIDHHNGAGKWDALSDNAKERFLSLTSQTAAAHKSNMSNPTRLADIRSLRIPTLVLCGEKTGRVYRQICEMLRQNLADGRYTCIEGAAHMSPLTHPETVAHAVRTHLTTFGAELRLRDVA